MKRLLYITVFLLIGTLAFQGFQCASPEMSTAKMAFQQKDLDKSEEYVKKELKKNPKNGEAHLLLAEIKMAKGDLEAAARTLDEGRQFITKKENKQKAAFLEGRILSNSYQTAYSSFQKFMQSNDDADAQMAIRSADLALLLRPQLKDLYNLKARVYETQNKNDKAIEEYEKFTEANRSELELAKDANLSIEMFREEAISLLGEPIESETKEDSARGLKTIADEIEYNGEKVYLYSLKNKEAESYKVTGWRSKLPEDWKKSERMQYAPINTDPYAALAQIFYERREYDKAIENLNALLTFLPSNKEAASLKIQIYQQTGRTDEAVAELEAATKKQPDNERYWLQYGDLLSNLEKYQEAIEKYEKAVEIKEDYGFALYNMASAYKNIASKKQKEEQEQLDKNPEYKIKTDRYFPDLEKAAENYKKALNSDRFKDDHTVYLQLANIYQVLEEDEKLDDALQTLDELEYKVPQEQKRTYYLDLLKIYSAMQDEEKTQEISRKLENLN